MMPNRHNFNLFAWNRRRWERRR